MRAAHEYIMEQPAVQGDPEPAENEERSHKQGAKLTGKGDDTPAAKGGKGRDKQGHRSPCYEFKEKGECSFGDSCRYSHGAAVNTIVQGDLLAEVGRKTQVLQAAVKRKPGKADATLHDPTSGRKPDCTVMTLTKTTAKSPAILGAPPKLPLSIDSRYRPGDQTSYRVTSTGSMGKGFQFWG